MMDSTGVRPPGLEPSFPLYPHLLQVCRITGPISGGVYPAFVQQPSANPLVLRDREACYVYDPNGASLNEEYEMCRLVGAWPVNDPASLPLFATICCGGGSTGRRLTSTSVRTIPITFTFNISLPVGLQFVFTLTTTTSGTYTNTFNIGLAPGVSFLLLISENGTTTTYTLTTTNGTSGTFTIGTGFPQSTGTTISITNTTGTSGPGVISTVGTALMVPSMPLPVNTTFQLICEEDGDIFNSSNSLGVPPGTVFTITPAGGTPSPGGGGGLPTQFILTTNGPTTGTFTTVGTACVFGQTYSIVTPPPRTSSSSSSSSSSSPTAAGSVGTISMTIPDTPTIDPGTFSLTSSAPIATGTSGTFTLSTASVTGGHTTTLTLTATGYTATFLLNSPQAVPSTNYTTFILNLNNPGVVSQTTNIILTGNNATGTTGTFSLDSSGTLQTGQTGVYILTGFLGGVIGVTPAISVSTPVGIGVSTVNQGTVAAPNVTTYTGAGSVVDFVAGAIANFGIGSFLNALAGAAVNFTGASLLPVTATGTLGWCKPDGTTITADPTGTLSAVGGGGGMTKLTIPVPYTLFTAGATSQTIDIVTAGMLNGQAIAFIYYKDSQAYTNGTTMASYTLTFIFSYDGGFQTPTIAVIDVFSLPDPTNRIYTNLIAGVGGAPIDDNTAKIRVKADCSGANLNTATQGAGTLIVWLLP